MGEFHTDMIRYNQEISIKDINDEQVAAGFLATWNQPCDMPNTVYDVSSLHLMQTKRKWLEMIFVNKVDIRMCVSKSKEAS